MGISSLGNFEYVNLVGHYNKLTYKDNIDPRLLTRGFSEEQIKQMMKRQSGRNTMEIISCNLHLKGDLERWQYPYFSYVMTLFEGYTSGIMPFPGPLTEQPAKIIDIFELLSQLKHEHQQKVRDDQARETAKQQRTKRG